ncbi:transferrin-binding protein-like solute binding protein [Defluviimonas sp. WL0075]|uniref:Transferrin-binding protein-like solute binding protein n=1 Tax=Albidovulum sediminicola TaxID=2984331 RepID=A0ABT2YYN4_9RHOB|nr:transferrin-binding protein-like solute binding protein [Defluviimonas sp. WL0075]MCV2863958.1 transferrin-binding protein-like solute binding protein [Defluviimonas sp. WL0075]
MKRRTLVLTCTAMAAALAACSSGSTSRSTSVYSVDAGTAGKALEDGKTLVAQKGAVAGMALNFDTHTAGLADSTFELKKNADGELTMVVDGVEYAFAPGDRYVEPSDMQIYGYNAKPGGSDIWLSNWRRTLDEALDPNDPHYADIWDYYINSGTQPDQYGFAVVGTETRPSDIGSLPTATYNGRARIMALPNDGDPDFSTARTQVRGDMEMTADFGAATIAGSIYNIETRPAGGSSFDPTLGSISMDETDIVGNSFDGTLTPDADLRTSLDLSADTSGTYSGRFYGPNAEEVAGTLTITGADGTGTDPFSGVGFFWGN